MEPIAPLPVQQAETPRTKTFVLKKLSPRHKQAASLLAQGLGREQVSKIIGCTPEYITMLGKQPLFLEYIKEMTQFADAQLQALFSKSVDVLATTLKDGTEMGKLRAAQLAMTAVGKAGVAKVDVHHKHSLMAVLASMPLEPFQNGTSLPNLNKEKDVGSGSAA